MVRTPATSLCARLRMSLTTRLLQCFARSQTGLQPVPNARRYLVLRDGKPTHFAVNGVLYSAAVSPPFSDLRKNRMPATVFADLASARSAVARSQEYYGDIGAVTLPQFSLVPVEQGEAIA